MVEGEGLKGETLLTLFIFLLNNYFSIKMTFLSTNADLNLKYSLNINHLIILFKLITKQIHFHSVHNFVMLNSLVAFKWTDFVCMCVFFIFS